MKIDIKHLRTVTTATQDQLQMMPTVSLLKRLKQLRALHERFENSDWLTEERDAVVEEGLIAFKDQENWKIAFDEVKKSLAKRDHLPRGSKEKRRAAQRQKQNR